MIDSTDLKPNLNFLTFTQRHPRIAAFITLGLALAVSALAWGLRSYAAQALSIDWDEDDYMRAAQDYATPLQQRDWSGLWQALQTRNYRPEHPQLAKLAYAPVLAALPPLDEIPDRDVTVPPPNIDPWVPYSHLRPVRYTGIVFATLQVLCLALLNPLSALFLASHTFHIKYSTQVMLEALPSLTSLICVLTYLKAQPASHMRWAWLLFSAIMLGLTAASKYLYVVAGVAVLLDWVLRATSAHRPTPIWRGLAGPLIWGGLGVLVFFAVQPYLWADPITRLSESVLYHGGFAQSAHVQNAGLPWWQPLLYLFSTLPGLRMAPTFAYLALPDVWFTLLALVGLRHTWRKQRLWVIWFGLALLFLLLWNTKWPQYMLILSAPLCMMAADGAREVLWPALRHWAHAARHPQRPPFNWAQAWDEWRTALPWLLPGAIALLLLSGFPLLYTFFMALTDLNARSIRDALNGAVVQQALGGLVGAFPANVTVDIMRGRAAQNSQVSYAGFGLLAQLFSLGSSGGLNLVLFTDIIWMVLSVTAQSLMGVAVALLLNGKRLRFARAWRTLFILPWAVPEFVGAIAWGNIFEPEAGLVAWLLGTVFAWRSSVGLTLLVLLVAATWMGFPMVMLAASAALKLIPIETKEAAQLDGASRWQTLRWITLPLLVPLVTPVILIRAIAAFNQFYLFDGLHPPLFNTLSHISYQVFDSSGGYGGQFAVSAAINLLNVLVLIILLVIFNKRTRAAEGVAYV